MRPGALCVPLAVWQLLQSPFGALADMARVFDPEMTFTVYGAVRTVDEL